MPRSLLRLPLLLAPGVALAPAASALVQFGAPADLTYALDDPADVATLDVDGDGHVDLLVTEGERLLLFVGDGAGGFAEPEVLADGIGGPTRLGLADVDADGVTDLLAVERTAGGVRFVRGLAAGGFEPPRLIATVGVSARSIASADLVGGPLPDLVVAAPLQGIFVIPQLAPGFFGAPQSVGSSGLRATDVAAGDIDGDGHVDLLFGARAPQRLSWLRSNGNGTFGNERFVTAGTGDAIDVDLEDLDGDGDLDGVVVWIGGGFDWHENLGNSHLSIAAPLAMGLDRPIDATARDLDGDADLDLLVASAGDGQLRWVENLGSATFGPDEAFGAGFGSPRVAGAADVDGDGLPDAITATERGALVVFRNLGVAAAPRFGGSEEVTRLARGASDSTLVDLDGDGDLDALVAESAAGRIIWFENEGQVEFSEQRVVSAGEDGVMRVIGADGDGDGVVDVFAASATTSRVSWATGLGAGAFGPSITIDVLPSPPTDLVASDLDGDGALDVIVSTELGATYWYRGAPGAPFGARQVAVAAPGRHVAPALVDFDGDGALDLGLALAGSVSWFRQLSPGAFGPEQSISGALQEPADAAFVDLDGDGQVDALWSLGSGPDVAWCRGLGGGSFDPPASLTAGAPGAGRSIVVADVDLDGDLDLTATFNPPAGFASLYVARQLGPGSFEPFSGVALSIRDASRIAVGDLDGDGDLEIVLPREASDSVTRLENETVSFLGAAYCGPAATNIAGLDGRIGAVGSLAVQNNSATLRASRLPVGVFGFFITSRTAIPPTPVGSGVGLLCVGGMIGRYIAPGQVLQAGADGGFELALDLANMPTPTGLVPALGGDTWNFQAWYRDSAGGSPSSNFTDALAITWE